MVLRFFLAVLLLGLGACSHVRNPVDKERGQFFNTVRDDILLAQGGKAVPNRIVYIENPRVAPSKLLFSVLVRGRMQSGLTEEYGRHLLMKGWTVLCVEDKEKGNIFISLVQNGKFKNFFTPLMESKHGQACIKKGERVG